VDDTSDRNVLKEKMVPGYDRTLRVTVLRSHSREKDYSGQSRVPEMLSEEHVASGTPVLLCAGYGSYAEPIFSITRLPL
jgi:hypothetical protein